MNFRVLQGKLTNLNLGWTRFGAFNLGDAVSGIDNFFQGDGTESLLFLTLKNIFLYNAGTEVVTFLNKRYEVNTVSATGDTPGVVTGATTLWDTTVDGKKNVKAGDEISFGATGRNLLSDTWYVIDTVDSDTQLTLTTAISGGAVSGGTSYTIRKVFTGDLATPWDTATFLRAAPGNADLWFATNGIDNIVTWNGSDSTIVELNTLGLTAKNITVYSNMMIYANVTQSGTVKPTDIVNSDLGTPEELASGLASQFVIHDGTDKIEGMAVLGDNLILYSNEHVTTAQFVGDPLVFAFRDAIVGTGPLNGRVIADFGDFHEFLGIDSQYAFDGVSLIKINKHVWRQVLRTRDPTREPLMFHHFDEENGDLIWAVPLVTDSGSGDVTMGPAVAYPEHYLEDTPNRGGPRGSQVPTPHSKREFPFTATGYFTRQTGLTWD